jgi:hypothetical protein
MCADDLCSHDTTIHTGSYNAMPGHDNEQVEQDTCEMLPDCMSEERKMIETLSSTDNPNQEHHTNTDPIWMINKSRSVVSQEDWGMPGFLTEEEFLIFVRVFSLLHQHFL